MPKLRQGYRQVATQLPVEVWDGLESLASANGRSVVDELTHAARRHLESPPVVRHVVETPPLPPAEVTPPRPSRRRRKPPAAG